MTLAGCWSSHACRSPAVATCAHCSSGPPRTVGAYQAANSSTAARARRICSTPAGQVAPPGRNGTECGHWPVNAVMTPRIFLENSRTCRVSSLTGAEFAQDGRGDGLVQPGQHEVGSFAAGQVVVQAAQFSPDVTVVLGQQGSQPLPQVAAGAGSGAELMLPAGRAASPEG